MIRVLLTLLALGALYAAVLALAIRAGHKKTRPDRRIVVGIDLAKDGGQDTFVWCYRDENGIYHIERIDP